MTRVISDEQFDALKSEHGEGRVIVIETEHAGDLAFRSPTKHEMQRFRESVGPNESGGRRAGALENLVRACVVLPKLPEFDEDLKKFPGLVETCINPLLELGGVEEKPRVRK
jgi:hypothetical protein